MDQKLNSLTRSALSDHSSSKCSFSLDSSSTPANDCTSPVVQLQSKFFPIQPKGGNISERDIRNAGILPIVMSIDSSGSSSSSSTTSSTIPLGKLKEPRDLYSTATLLHPIKWPVECQVIPDKIRHIDSTPHKLEPFYSPTGKEPQPQPVGVEMGTVVYDYQPKLSVDYFCRATVGGSQDYEEYDSVHNLTETSALKFESRFESGNLAKAIKVTNMYYELYLRPDLYTERHSQWFYFRIQNTKDNVQYRFSIVNFNKPDSLYRYGLKILMYSEKEAQLNQVGWTRCGQNITYFKNDISPDENGPYYTLTFNLKFRHNNDTVYLAQCYPYTYSTLQHYLKSIEDDQFKSQLLTIRLLCRSLAGNNVHVLTVTSPDNQQTPVTTTITVPPSSTMGPTIGSNVDEESLLPNSNKKPVIVISARVHPGETQSSYMMKGIIDFLTSDCSQAKELRDRFIFKLIPMLNPDGVIVGNSRCCLLGQDLNRQYRTVLREAFPQIYHAKVMMRRLQEENGIFLYCDLHGHSRRHNVFIYGCENRRVPERKLLEQVFPLMMHKNAADKFSFQNCKFKIQKNKEGTGRIFVWTLGVVNSYTLEISLGGSTMPSRQFTHFNTADYEACGRHFCETLLDYSDPNPMKENLRDRILQKLVDEGSTADEPKNVVLSDYSSLSHSETDGEEDDNDDERDDEDSSPETETASSSILKSLTSSGISSASMPSSSGVNASTPLKQFKRQTSLNKHRHLHFPPPQYRTKSAGRISSRISFESSRSPLPIHRASVDFTKIKQRKLEEPFSLLATVPPPSPNNIDEDADMEIPSSSSKEISSASYRRLTKFRRKSKKHNGSSLYAPSGITDNPEQLRHLTTQQQQYQLTAKCTRILFDDPFNPPGTQQQMQKPYHHKKSARIMRDSIEVFDLNSGTEDECDPYDNMSAGVNRFPNGSTAPTIKITDFSSISISEEIQAVAGDMARLKVSSKQQRSSSDSESQSNQASFPSFAPFVPSFPVGKAYLQAFYPDKSNSPREGDMRKITNSLSDTTISTGDATSAMSSAGSSTSNVKQPTPRRSSISYMGGGGTIGAAKGRLQATGMTMVSSRESASSSRRRVSWTGTLTVSVPTVPNTVMLRSPTGTRHPARKSFRKSKSLNDKPNQQTGQRQSSTDMTDSAGSLVTSGSLDKIPSGSGNSTKGKVGSYLGYSQSTGSLVGVTGIPSTSSTKKKKSKLKRSKNK